jgi:hypothetical protein
LDFDVAPSSGRKVTVSEFGAIVGKLGNLSYGTGAGQVGLVNNSVLAPDPGETNLPAAPGVPGGRLLLGITANNGTYTHGTETSSGATDLYRGVAIGGWTDAGALAAILNGPSTGTGNLDLNVHIVAPPGLMPGNLTVKNINPTATQLNTSTGKVNMLGQGRVIINAGGSLGGNWTILNRTGDPNFRGANNVVLELAGGADIIGGGKTVKGRSARLSSMTRHKNIRRIWMATGSSTPLVRTSSSSRTRVTPALVQARSTSALTPKATPTPTTRR